MSAAVKLLVVEDDALIRESLLEALVDHGYDVVGARDGREALSVLESSTERPALIVLDLMMPVMDGREFRDEQLKRPHLADIPVVVMSAYRDVATIAAEMKVAAHVKKPVPLRDLLRVIREHGGAQQND